MASVVGVWKVHYHFERSGKKASPEYVDYVQAADSSFNTISGVITQKYAGATLVIDAVVNAIPAGAIA